ncbi:Serine/threonine-protein kinase ULK4 [Tetrabaena socialis]|uniref:Serine/threonine-protein kinase ULK4 n=1 Tax=Tetrabaena socialis TaxID=47790 RepID=A0A2J8AG28_9CHLO|nr:Serine/threonine-protein kinase ULK4 [Tetrabaena socialis]|eukprot:PNH11471.1 Serine/threonine-protein kinase ULK4 [Tetrabaena socialis]
MNNYHIYEKIGHGKHSTVYKGRKKKTISYYAIKSVDKTQKARVLQEVRTMHALDHRNILKFFAWYETTNHLWLILEYCVGGDLMSLLRQDVRLPESSVHDFARDVIVALQFLHSKEIIYCDLKPSNILLDENGRLKLGGFGLSRRLADINKKPLQALPQAMRGTPCYMAPELFSEGATHSTASDLWAIGCVLYECSMGRPPFMNSSFNQLVHEILNNEPQPIPGASPEYHDVISRMLDKNPATRIKWRVRLPSLELPPEPALDAFIARYNLAPTMEEMRQSTKEGLKLDKGRNMRQSVDITRLSRIALHNLEREGEGADYSSNVAGAAAAEAQPGDIRIDSADAELDFEENREEAVDEESPVSPAPSDDGLVIDQGSGTPISDGSRMISATANDAMMARAAAAAHQTGHGPHTGAGTSRRGGADAAMGGSGGSAAAAAAASGPSSRSHAAEDEHLRAAVGSGGDAGAASAAASGAAGSASASVSMDDDLLVETGPLVTDPASMEELIWHTSDTAVKPIVANRRIERLPEPRYDAASLPFKPWSLPEMLGANQADLEAFLTHIYRAIASAAPLKDKNERVRRRVIATLGELLFYIATQQQDNAAAAAGAGGAAPADPTVVWGITGNTYAQVMRLLKDKEDEVAVHYAVKTVENICSQGGEWAARFATQDVVLSLVQLVNSPGRGEQLRATAASTLARLLRCAAWSGGAGALCQQGELVLQHYAAVLNVLLPALCSVVSAEGEGGDTRFFCLRMVSDVLQTVLLDEELYGGVRQRPEGGAPIAAGSGVAAPAIDRVLRSYILPLVPRLLRDEDPMPLYALKLLGGLLEINLAYVADVEAMGLAAQFFEFLSLEHSNNNVHNIRLCRQIIAAGSLPIAQLAALQVAEKVAAVLEYATTNSVEPFLEPVLELVNTILQRDALEVSQGRSDGSLAATFLEQAGVLLDNCAHPDVPICSSAAGCLSNLVALFPQQCGPWLLSPENAAAVASVLGGQHLLQQPAPGQAAAAVPPALQQPLLEAVATALEVAGATAPSEELAQLYDVVRQSAASSQDANVRSIAGEVAAALNGALH